MKKSNNFNLRIMLARWGRTAVLIGVVACGNSPRSPQAPGPPRGDSHSAAHAHGHHHPFDDAAKWSKVFDDPARDEWQRPARVLELMAISPGMSVADVGAGTGYFTVHLARAVGRDGVVVAEDVEPEMVAWLSERAQRDGLANVKAHLGSADDPKLLPGSLGRVLVVDTWHHVDDRPAFAKKLADALQPGGAVFIVDFTRDSPHGPPPAMRLAPEAVMADLAAAGLRAEVLADAGLPHQYVVRGSR
jgi:SAM-dependent methyltransferase